MDKGFPCGSVIRNLPSSVGDRRLRFHPWVEKILWSRKGHPTPAFLPGKFHGPWSLVGYSPRGSKELAETEQLILATFKVL